MPTPSKIKSTAKSQPLPFNPIFLPTLSATMPPTARAKIFMKPNMPANKPAVAKFAWKVSTKYIAAILSKVISIPKQAP